MLYIYNIMPIRTSRRYINMRGGNRSMTKVILDELIISDRHDINEYFKEQLNELGLRFGMDIKELMEVE